MNRGSRFTLGLFMNSLLAWFGTAVVETPLGHLYRVHNIDQVLEKEYLLSAGCALLLGYFVYRRWRPTSARWVWVMGFFWFVVGVVSVLHSQPVSVLASHPPSLLRTFSGADCIDGTRALGCRDWLLFTLPALRLVIYSLGALLCAGVGHEGSH
jgi:hypothetical protein